MNEVFPAISIIVPVYNVKEYVGGCLESIINQSIDNIEIIVVDDASNDGSSEICEHYANVDKRIRLIRHNNNMGLSATRNTALDIARGNYVGFVDSDDTVEPDMFLKMLQYAETSDADIVMCGYNVIDELGNITFQYMSKNKSLVGIDKIKENVSTSNNCVWNKLFKREMFEDIRFFVGKIFEDIFLMHLIFDKAKKVCVVDEVLYNYRQRQSSITLSPFTLSNLDIIEAYWNRYLYISQKYPEEIELVQKAGQKLFENLEYCFRRAYNEGKLNTYINELYRMVEMVSIVNREDLNLESSLEGSINLIFKDIRLYVFAIKCNRI